MLLLALKILLLLISTVALGGPTELRKCLMPVPHYCVCSEDDIVELKPVRMCLYPNDQSTDCLPCPIIHQDLLNCPHSDFEFPLCSLQKFSPEQFRGNRNIINELYTGTEQKFIQFTQDRYITFKMRNPMSNGRVNTNNPQFYRSDQSLAIKGNRKINPRTQVLESNSENAKQYQIFGNEDILTNTEVDKEFRIPKPEILARIDAKEELRNLNHDVLTENGVYEDFRIPRQDILSKTDVESGSLIHDILTNADINRKFLILTPGILPKTDINEEYRNERLVDISDTLPKSNVKEISGNLTDDIMMNTGTNKDFGIFNQGIWPKIVLKEKSGNLTRDIQLKPDAIEGSLKDEILRFIRYINMRGLNSSTNANITAKRVHNSDLPLSETALLQNDMQMILSKIEKNLGEIGRTRELSSQKMYSLKGNTANETQLKNGMPILVGYHLIFLRKSKFNEIPKSEFETNIFEKERIPDGTDKSEIIKTAKHPDSPIIKIAAVFKGNGKINKVIDIRNPGGVSKSNFFASAGRNTQNKVLADDSNSLDFKEKELTSSEGFERGYPLKQFQDKMISRQSPPNKEDAMNDSSKFQVEDLSFGAADFFEDFNLNTIEPGNSRTFRLVEQNLNTTKNVTEDFTTVKLGNSSMEEKSKDTNHNIKVEKFNTTETFPRDGSNNSLEEGNVNAFRKAGNSHKNVDIKSNSEKFAFGNTNATSDAKTFPKIHFMRNSSYSQKNDGNSRKFSAFVNRTSRNLSRADTDLEENIDTFQGSFNDKTDFEKFLAGDPAVRYNDKAHLGNSTSEKNASVTELSKLHAVTSVPTTESRSSVNDYVSLPRSKGKPKKYSPSLYKKSKITNKKFKNQQLYTNKVISSDEPQDKIREFYNDTGKSEVETLQNGTLVRIKRWLQLDENEGKELVRFSINDSDIRTRRKRSTFLPHNSWCPIGMTTRHGNLDCKIWTYKKKCLLRCHEGYEFEGKGEAYLKCDRRDSKWEPKITEACKLSFTPLEPAEEPFEHPDTELDSRQPLAYDSYYGEHYGVPDLGDYADQEFYYAYGDESLDSNSISLNAPPHYPEPDYSDDGRPPNAKYPEYPETGSFPELKSKDTPTYLKNELDDSKDLPEQLDDSLYSDTY